MSEKFLFYRIGREKLERSIKASLLLDALFTL